MTAIDETAAAAAGPGKSTRDSSRLSVDDATRATLPQLPYADAVHHALAGLQLAPDLVETGMREEQTDGPCELFLRLEWLPGHDDLVPAAARSQGLIVEWSHLGGWSVRCGGDLAVLDADTLADPDVIADAAMHAALCGLGCACEKPAADRWEHAVYLDIALVHFDERGAVQ
ncbi:hypothetical protein ACWEQC_32630 [Streptomyces shenzhenensis]